jgi:hypothetical protein
MIKTSYLFSDQREAELRQNFFRNYLVKETGETNPSLAMAALLQKVSGGRFVSEYCKLMALKLAPVHPEISAQLQRRVQKSNQIHRSENTEVKVLVSVIYTNQLYCEH